MGDNKDEHTGFELLPFSQEMLDKAQEVYEVRRIWDNSEQIWYYSIVDFVRLLTESKSPNVYWSALKKRDSSLEEILKKVKVFPLRSKDGRLRDTECATREMMLRIIQSIPSTSPLVEAAKLWLAQIGEEKLQEVEQKTQEEELREYYIKQKGRTPEWADARIRNLVGRNALTDEWLARGAQQNLHFGILTNTIHRGTFGITTAEHHKIKQLPKSVKNPRDHYTEEELGVLTLAELAARRRHEQNDSQGVPQLLDDAKLAGKFGEQVRVAFEELTGEPVVSTQNFLDKPKGKSRKTLSSPEQVSLFPQEEEKS